MSEKKKVFGSDVTICHSTVKKNKKQQMHGMFSHTVAGILGILLLYDFPFSYLFIVISIKAVCGVYSHV